MGFGLPQSRKEGPEGPSFYKGVLLFGTVDYSEMGFWGGFTHFKHRWKAVIYWHSKESSLGMP